MYYKGEKTRLKPLGSADPFYDLWWLMIQTQRAIYKVRTKELSQYGIGPEEAGVLFSIKAAGTLGQEVTPAEISRWLLREPHTISSLVARMEKKGLVRKYRDMSRKNLVRVAVTRKGRKAYAHSLERASIYQIMGSLSDEECRLLRTCLKKLRHNALKELGIRWLPHYPLPT